MQRLVQNKRCQSAVIYLYMLVITMSISNRLSINKTANLLCYFSQVDLPNFRPAFFIFVGGFASTLKLAFG